MNALGVLGGETLAIRDLQNWGRWSDVVLAADRGFDHLVRAGIRADHVIGDFDSVTESLTAQESVHHDQDQDTSDVDKLLILARTLGVKTVALACAHGGRMDHLLGIVHSALQSPLDVEIIFPEELAVLVIPGQVVRWSGLVGRRLSAFPITPAKGVHLTGTQWTLTNSEMFMGETVSLSNEIVSDVEIQLKSGSLLVFVERSEGEVLRLRQASL